MGSQASRGYGPGHAPAGRRTDPPGARRAARGHARAGGPLLPGRQGVDPALGRPERRRRGGAGRRAGDPAPARGAVRALRLHRSHRDQRAAGDRQDARVRAPRTTGGSSSRSSTCSPSTSRRGSSARTSWAATPSRPAARTSRPRPRRAPRCSSARSRSATPAGPLRRRRAACPAAASRKVTAEEWDALKRKIGPQPRDCPDVDLARPAARRARASMVWQNAHPALGGDAGHDDKPGQQPPRLQRHGRARRQLRPRGRQRARGDRRRRAAARPAARARLQHDLAGRRGTTTTCTSTSAARADRSLGGGGFGFAGPLDHTGLEVKLVDWEKPVDAARRPRRRVRRRRARWAARRTRRSCADVPDGEAARPEDPARDVRDRDRGVGDPQPRLRRRATRTACSSSSGRQGWGYARRTPCTRRPPPGCSSTRRWRCRSKYPNVSAGQLAAAGPAAARGPRVQVRREPRPGRHA